MGIENLLQDATRQKQLAIIPFCKEVLKYFFYIYFFEMKPCFPVLLMAPQPITTIDEKKIHRSTAYLAALCGGTTAKIKNSR